MGVSRMKELESFVESEYQKAIRHTDIEYELYRLSKKLNKLNKKREKLKKKLKKVYKELVKNDYIQRETVIYCICYISVRIGKFSQECIS